VAWVVIDRPERRNAIDATATDDLCEAFSSLASDPELIELAPQPVLAVVEGAALGAGAALCLASDLRLLGTSASIGWPEVRRGYAPALNGLWLADAVPRNLAAELLFLGQPVDAARALQLGLANWVVEDADLESAASDLLARLLAVAPLGVRGAKESLNLAARPRPLAEAAEIVERVAASKDATEGIKAFLERREPRWSGR
jgi:enoyl-CoA hydratase/carnithine racemase